MLADLKKAKAGGFGASLAVSGAWLAVGASSSAGGGKVFMFKKQSNKWVQQQVLTGPAGHNNFGALCMHGNTLAVTSSATGFPTKSSISIFTLSGNTWSLSQTLAQSSGANNYWYNNIDMSDDGY